MRVALTSLLLASLAVSACVGGSADTSKEDKDRLKAFVTDKAPPGIHALNVNYDGKAMLLGYRMEPDGNVAPGGKVKLTMYWRCDKDIEDGWNLFTHVLDGSGERVLNIDNVGPIREWRGNRQALSPSIWEPGKVYIDEQEFTIPANVKTAKIQVTTGIWKGNDRIKITGGPGDREHRASVVEIQTGVKQGPPPPDTRIPELRVDRLEKGAKIKIDGKLDEAEWGSAPVAGPFVDVGTGRPNPGFPVSGSVKLLWDDTNLYLGFEVKDPDIVGGFDKKAKDPKLWTKDTVEIMVDPDGNGDNKDYYEIQINPQNLVFDSQFDDYNAPKKDPDGPFGHQDWSAKLKSAVTVNGTLDKDGDKDEGYVVEVQIPWKSFAKAAQLPPKVGDSWRMNFYAMQENNGVAWSPILGQGNFHKAARFGKVTWAEKGWQPPAPPALSAVPMGSTRPRVLMPNRELIKRLKLPKAPPKP
ncbi:MAG: carbohydrate-binding family 9-like protein [Polyangiaceae bacterium]